MEIKSKAKVFKVRSMVASGGELAVFDAFDSGTCNVPFPSNP
jgi:hypothetical protein